ncbi:hypothetical protein VF_A0871 [Aliivibrio fischeri ES114]|uniref:Uncharacterized protein n=1 Tax=Aliivibrio fischeri (strain ATCC 700601 / ES114) TaxID=312309 RepID=Q5DZ55_ALIF1|nr:hypothetical protein [Aliivibrio fischeri]AAW87941.1 hypothetical protein VF_A0871 [Aliivibrio fischeri ES114]KLU80426.1 hypothetical protein AB192_00945 [Aliivibrio fischeri]
MIIDDFVWLPKSDLLIGKLEKLGWKTLFSVKTNDNNIYYCLSSTVYFLDDKIKQCLLSSICVVNNEYKDCLVLFDEFHDVGFLWKDKKCINLKEQTLLDIVGSDLDFSLKKNIIRISSINDIVDEADIKIRKYYGFYPLLISISFLILFLLVGAWLWLF